ncbi:MAG: hypothetical protein BWY06_00169 [Candidatus Latescibacteria bacterium ADurb.Bin168]|nr:MAG: hypothetical protein BWY06_00169 [Candidatus Latescibacteria bacterium ADurb.Bin168]
MHGPAHTREARAGLLDYARPTHPQATSIATSDHLKSRCGW